MNCTFDAKTLAACTGATLLRAAYYLPVIAAAMQRHGIVKPLHVAAFLAQIGIESGGLSRLEENLYYTTAARLMAVWPSRFHTEKDATPYLRNPEALANLVYGGRMGNSLPGDGYRYRGRGLKQITGKDNYTAYMLACDMDALGNPDLLLQPEQAADSAAWFWASTGCPALADARNWKALTRVINGGYNGLEERIALTRKAMQTLGVA